MQIIDTGLVFTKTPDKRRTTEAVVLHHSDAQSQTVGTIHNYHINANGWSGIGYNFYIRKNGDICKGRGWDAVGAHAGASSGYNTKSIGICFEGKYHDVDKSMPDAQFGAGVWLTREAIARYGKLAILGHRDVTATGCPGRYFPFDQMKKEALMAQESVTVNTNQPSDWAKEAWEWAKGKGITDGTSPQAPCTREMIITMLYRALKGTV